jgi:replicative DNA helicase
VSEVPVRVPPHDVLAEQSVLGSMMLTQAAVWDALGVVEAGDFFEPKHEDVFGAILSLISRGVGVDAVSVADELGRVGALPRVGGASFLHELTGVPSSTRNAAYHAGIVKRLAVRRRLVIAGEQATAMGYSAEGDVYELVERARASVDAVAGSERGDVRPIGDVYDEVVTSLSERPMMVPTPWPELADLLPGLQPGRVYVIAARPGEGKSIVGLQLARALCSFGPVAFSSLEMSRTEVMQRLFASVADVNMSDIERSSLTQAQWERVALNRSLLTQLPLHVDDRPGVTMTQIKAHARSVSRKGHLAGVVIDYLQLVSGPAREDRYAIVSEVSRQTKIMARELDVPVVALSQLNRGSATRGKVQVPPSLADLRESGAIEQDADAVVLMQRKVDDNGQPVNEIGFHVAKHRNGKTGFRTLHFNGAYSRVDSWPRIGLGPSRPD